MPRVRRTARTDSPASVKELDFTPRGEVFPSPVDWRDQFLYELMIDRFDDGKSHPPYDARRAKSQKPLDPKDGKIFQGGTLKGITRRLNYLRDMGVTGLWITSPLKNRQDDKASYHGYGAQD